MVRLSKVIRDTTEQTAITGGELVSIVDEDGSGVTEHFTVDTLQAWLEASNDGRYGLVGTGSPEGVVTAAVGSRFWDTAATNGAREWYKATGVGNTGWEVSNGFVERNVASLLAGTWTATRAPVLWRQGRICGISGYLAVGSTANSDILTGIPLGFRETNNAGQFSTGILGRTSGPSGVAFLSGDEIQAKALTATSSLSLNMQWRTTDPWPTTLPGVAL